MAEFIGVWRKIMAKAFKLQTACAGALLALTPVHGVADVGLESGDFEGYPVVSNQELAALRGGFELNIGGQLLSLAFSLEQVTYLNGQLLTSTKIVVPDIAAAILSPQTISVMTGVAPAVTGEAGGNPVNPSPQIAGVSVPSQDAGSAASLPPQTIPASTDAAPATGEAGGYPVNPSPQVAGVSVPSQDAGSAASLPPQTIPASTDVAPATGEAGGNPVNPPPQIASVSVPGQDAGSYVTLIQNGAGNSVALPAEVGQQVNQQVSQQVNQQVNQALQAAQAQILQAYNHVTVIQNSLDNQVIQNMTTLNVTLSNAALAQAAALNAGLAQVLNMPIVLPK
jgi:hypothetical protein